MPANTGSDTGTGRPQCAGRRPVVRGLWRQRQAGGAAAASGTGSHRLLDQRRARRRTCSARLMVVMSHEVAVEAAPTAARRARPGGRRRSGSNRRPGGGPAGSPRLRRAGVRRPDRAGPWSRLASGGRLAQQRGDRERRLGRRTRGLTSAGERGPRRARWRAARLPEAATDGGERGRGDPVLDRQPAAGRGDRRPVGAVADDRRLGGERSCSAAAGPRRAGASLAGAAPAADDSGSGRSPAGGAGAGAGDRAGSRARRRRRARGRRRGRPVDWPAGRGAPAGRRTGPAAGAAGPGPGRSLDRPGRVEPAAPNPARRTPSRIGRPRRAGRLGGLRREAARSAGGRAAGPAAWRHESAGAAPAVAGDRASAAPSEPARWPDARGAAPTSLEAGRWLGRRFQPRPGRRTSSGARPTAEAARRPGRVRPAGCRSDRGQGAAGWTGCPTAGGRRRLARTGGPVDLRTASSSSRDAGGATGRDASRRRSAVVPAPPAAPGGRAGRRTARVRGCAPAGLIPGRPGTADSASSGGRPPGLARVTASLRPVPDGADGETEWPSGRKELLGRLPGRSASPRSAATPPRASRAAPARSAEAWPSPGRRVSVLARMTSCSRTPRAAPALPGRRAAGPSEHDQGHERTGAS